MPDRRSPSAAALVERKAEQLAEAAAEKAARLARADAERATALAVERALRDARVDGKLRDHDAHLDAINGSQEKMANSLREMVETHKTQLAVTGALSKQLENQAKGRFSRWSIWVGVALALAAYGGIIATIVTANS